MPESFRQLMIDVIPLLQWQLWVAPGFFMLLGIVAGVVVEKLLVGTLRRLFNHTALELNDAISATLRGVILWIFGLWGVQMATYSIHFLDAETLGLIRRILFVIAMVLAIQIIAKISVACVRFYLNRSNGAHALRNTSIFENIVRLLIFALGFIMLLQTLGISVVPLITALGVGGLAISLGLQDTLANLFAGINMILARQIKVGDTIQLENGQSGLVEDIGWRTTILRQLSGNQIILPNSKLASNILLNYTQPHPELTVSVTLPVSANQDLDKLENLAMDVAADVGKKLLREKQKSKQSSTVTPVIRYQSYGDSWLNMLVSLPFPVALDAGLVKHELIKALHQRFRVENIEIPFSERQVHMIPLEKSVSRPDASSLKPNC